MNQLIRKTSKIFVLLGIFSIAMGFLEAIVVVYLRQIYYPHGFNFPLSPLSQQALSVEWLREIATIIMLVTVGMIAGKNSLQKFFYFLYSFAIWDIFYYVGLKLLINWPPSLLTWDILFLIPVGWTGPVLAPVICSLTMLFFAVSIVYLQASGYTIKIKLWEWGSILLGAIVIFSTYIWDFSSIIIHGGFLSNFLTVSNYEPLQEVIAQYRPSYYHWYLFALGEIFILATIGVIIRRTIFQSKKDTRSA